MDAKTGEEHWRYDPDTDRSTIRYACCGSPLNRGVAAYKGRIYFAHLRRQANRPGPGHRGEGLGGRYHGPPDEQPLHGDQARPGSCTARCSSGREQFGVRPARPPIGLRRGYGGNSPGASSRSRAIRPNPSSIPNSRRRPRPGRASGGSWVAAARSGIPSSTTPSSINYCSEPATAAPWPRAIRSPGRRRQPVPRRRHVGQPPTPAA